MRAQKPAGICNANLFFRPHLASTYMFLASVPNAQHAFTSSFHKMSGAETSESRMDPPGGSKIERNPTKDAKFAAPVSPAITDNWRPQKRFAEACKVIAHSSIRNGLAWLGFDKPKKGYSPSKNKYLFPCSASAKEKNKSKKYRFCFWNLVS